MLIAVNHHYIRHNYDLPYPGINGITPGLFRDKLRALSAHGNFVSGKQIADALTGKDKLPERAIMITFDDGLKEQYEIALPILNELGIPALFFINSINLQGAVSSVHKIHLLRSYLSSRDFSHELQEFIRGEGDINLDIDEAKKAGPVHYIYDDPQTAALKYTLNFILPAQKLELFINLLFPKYFNEWNVAAELYMTHAQVSSLNKKGYLGSHGHEHFPLAQLSKADSQFQINKSQEILAEISGNAVEAFSYPYGSDEAINGLAEQLQSGGFKFAFTMKRGGNTAAMNPFYLNRFDNNDMPLGKANRFPAGVNIFDHLKESAHAG